MWLLRRSSNTAVQLDGLLERLATKDAQAVVKPSSTTALSDRMQSLRIRGKNNLVIGVASNKGGSDKKPIPIPEPQINQKTTEPDVID